MALRRVFVDRIDGRSAVVRGPSARHLSRVARLRPGERVEVSDQKQAHSATTESCAHDEVRFRVEESLPAPPVRPQLDVALALIRVPRFEWAIEKLTELGATAIVPVFADRSDARLRQAVPKRVKRWNRIAFEAAQQSRRLAAPPVSAPKGLADVLSDCTGGSRLFADLDGTPVDGEYAGGDATCLVGPEGGWTDAERAMAESHGFAAVRLGPTVLRSETAAVALAAICMARTGSAGASDGQRA